MKAISKNSLFACGLAALNIIVFLPAFSLGPRADSLAHLANTSTLNSLADLLTFFLSQETNEALLFRPLLHTWLAIEIWLFRFNFFYCQIISFLLHIAVIWQMTKTFPEIRQSFLWYTWITLFSVLTISAEMVAWPQISGYLIFILCFLQAFKSLSTTIAGKDKTLPLTFWLLLGGLFYEFSFICCIVFFFTLQSAKKNLKIPQVQPWLILMPTTIVLPFLFSTACRHPIIFHPLNLTKWVDSLRKVLMGIPYALLPTTLSFEPNVGRLCLNKMEFAKPNILLSINILAILLFILGIIYCTKQTPRAALAKNRPLSTTLVFLFILQSCFILVRVALHPLDNYMNLSLYHYYFTLLLIFLWLPATLPAQKISERTAWPYRILTIAISLLIVVNALSTYQIYYALAKRMKPWTNFLIKTDHFVKSHRKEKNFSFQIVYAEFSLPLPLSVPKKNSTQSHEFELLFKPYISQYPSYHLVYFQKTGLRVFTTRTEALRFMKNTF